MGPLSGAVEAIAAQRSRDRLEGRCSYRQMVNAARTNAHIVTCILGSIGNRTIGIADQMHNANSVSALCRERIGVT